MRFRAPQLISFVLLIASCGGSGGGSTPAAEPDGSFRYASASFVFVDTSRPTAENNGVPGKDSRTLRTAVYYPTAPTGDGAAPTDRRFPLIIFAHGFTGLGRVYNVILQAWAEAGRPAPRLTTSFWFAVGDEPREQVRRHLRHYMNWLPTSLVDALASTAGFAGSPTALRDQLKRFEDIGCDEVHLIPTSSDRSQVERIAEIL